MCVTGTPAAEHGWRAERRAEYFSFEGLHAHVEAVRVGLRGTRVQRQRSVSVWVARANVAAVMAVAVLVLLLVAPRYAAGAERSITLARADALALAVLRPSAQAGQVVLFRSRRPLVAGDAVTEAGPRVRHGRSALFPHGIGHRAWMFWEDLAFNSPFVHPSRVLLIDAVSGAVL